MSGATPDPHPVLPMNSSLSSLWLLSESTEEQTEAGEVSQLAQG